MKLNVYGTKEYTYNTYDQSLLSDQFLNPNQIAQRHNEMLSPRK